MPVETALKPFLGNGYIKMVDAVGFEPTKGLGPAGLQPATTRHRDRTSKNGMVWARLRTLTGHNTNS